jgi:hypothetical protein
LGAELVVPVERLFLLWSLLRGSTIGGFTVIYMLQYLLMKVVNKKFCKGHQFYDP